MRLRILAAAAVAALTLGGCGGSETSPDQSLPESSLQSDDPGLGPLLGDTSSDDPDAVEPVEEEVSDPGSSISYAWENLDSYSFAAEVTGLVTMVSTDIADQKPGEALVNVAISGDAEITNTTPGRNARPDWTEVLPAWPMSAQICKQEISEVTELLKGVEEELTLSDNRKPTGYCTLAKGVRGSLETDLAPDETTALSYAGDAGVDLIVPEGSLPAIEQDAAEPAMWLLVRGWGDYGANSSGPEICLGGYGSTVVATSNPDLGVCEQGVQ